MKTKRILLIIPFLFVIMGMGSCEEKEQIKTILPITNLSEQIISFFEGTLPTTAESNCFFVSEESNVHYLINSIEELQAIYSCDNELPEIDFASYSIIVGQKRMPNSYYSVVEQNIKETETLDLNIFVQLPLDGHWPAFSNMYYWGIYPKLPNKKINVNIINRELP
ncbi:MAG: hypothetical protein LHW59_11915 [Candidatus Cloacimonetes bacterium]|nr:hypothetical protein [Candidatus Cloacimonadota bacterium]